MQFENRNYAYTGAFIDELVRCGLRHVCICPGSRSTPLAISFAREKRIKTWLHLDERSAAFFALGTAKALEQPVALVCTSGSAAANFFPAVVEASYAHVPLIVLTSDRPPEVREWGAAQTIDQPHIYGSYVKWSETLPTDQVTSELMRFTRATACRAYAMSIATPAGPVHINAPFREPLVPLSIPQDIQPNIDPIALNGRDNGQPLMSVSEDKLSPRPADLKGVAEVLQRAQHGIIVCGPTANSSAAEHIVALAQKLGYPVLADPLSHLRAGSQDKRLILTRYDTFLREPAIAQRSIPEVVLRFGAIPTSSPLNQLIDGAISARTIVVRESGWSNPSHTASQVINADPAEVSKTLLQRIADKPWTSPWLEQWLRVEKNSRDVIEDQLEEMSDLFEGKIFSELARLLPEGATLFTGNSMPVRDMDVYFPTIQRGVCCVGNRGANGIDGVVSTALGVSAASTSPVVLVIGDISFYHDMNGLLAAKRYGLNATIVVVNNDGGGIFSFLRQAEYPEVFENYFGTPHGLEFKSTAELYGLRYYKISSWEEFRTAVQRNFDNGGTGIIEFPSNRLKNVEMHRRISAAVHSVLRKQA